MSEEKSAACMKVSGCFCMGMALAPLIAFSTVYWQLYNGAVAYNEDPFNALPLDAARPFDITPYDACGGDMIDPSYTTDWMMIFRFNAIMYTIMLSFVASSCLCLFFAPLMMFGICCFMCAGIPTFAALIMTGLRRFASEGDMCSLVTDEVSDGVTFMDNGSTLKAVFIAQCVMHVPLFCFFMCGF